MASEAIKSMVIDVEEGGENVDVVELLEDEHEKLVRKIQKMRWTRGCAHRGECASEA